MASPALVVRVAANLAEFKKNLEEGKSQIEATSASIGKLANSLNGDRLIAQAHNIEAAVRQVGGAATLTDAQKAKLNRTLDEAIQKYQRLGKEAPASMVALSAELKKVETSAEGADRKLTLLGGASDGSTTKLGALSTSVGQVDRVLAAAGISLGPVPGALRDLSGAADLGAGKLGMLATAALGVGAAMIGWKIGSWIADVTSLDEKLGDAIVSLGLYGDAAAAGAAEKTRLLAEASRIAGKEITNVAQAAKILQENGQRNSVMMIDFAGNLEAASRQVAGLTAEQLKEIQVAQQAGATQKELEIRYGLSATAVKLLGDRIKDETAAADAQKKAHDSMFGLDLIARAEGYLKTLGGVENATRLTTEKKLELHKAVGKALEVYEALGQKAPAALREVHAATLPLIEVTRSLSSTNSGFWVEYKASVEDGKQQMREIAEAAYHSAEHWSSAYHEALTEVDQKVEETTTKTTAAIERTSSALRSLVGMTFTGHEASADELQSRYWELVMNDVALGATLGEAQRKLDEAIRRARERAQPRADGGPVSAGSPYVVGERGPELFVPQQSGTIVPNGGGGSVVVQVHFHGPFYGMNQADAGRHLAEMLAGHMKSQGARWGRA